MKEILPFTLLTPQGLITKGEATLLYVDTVSGPVGITPNHDTFLARLPKKAKVHIYLPEGEKTYLAEEGFCLVDPDKITLWSVSFSSLS